MSRAAEAGFLDVESAALYFRSFSGVSVFVSLCMSVYVGFFVVIWPQQVSYQLSAALSALFDLFFREGSPPLSPRFAPGLPEVTFWKISASIFCTL